MNEQEILAGFVVSSIMTIIAYMVLTEIGDLIVGGPFEDTYYDIVSAVNFFFSIQGLLPVILVISSVLYITYRYNSYNTSR